MTRSPYHTVIRRRHGGWIALRMCDETELYRAEGKTWNEARLNLIRKALPGIVASAFESRNEHDANP